MNKTGFVDGECLTLEAVTNSDQEVAVQATWWRRSANVAEVTLIFPMKTWENAVYFVETADDAVFKRAFEQFKQDVAMVDLLEAAFAKAKEPKQAWRGISGRK